MGLSRVGRIEKVLLSQAESAQILGCSVKLVRVLVQSGVLETRTLPGQRHPKVTRASIDRYVGAVGKAEKAPSSRPLTAPIESPWDRKFREWRAADAEARRLAAGR